MQSARHMRGAEAAEDRQKKNFFHPKADDEARRLFKKKVSFYELMRISLIYINESGFSEDMPRIFVMRQQARDALESMI